MAALLPTVTKTYYSKKLLQIMTSLIKTETESFYNYSTFLQNQQKKYFKLHKKFYYYKFMNIISYGSSIFSLCSWLF